MKARDANMDLMRITAMLLVMLFHDNFYSIAKRQGATFVDTYTPMVTGNSQRAEYFSGNYLNGIGYAAMAEVLAAHVGDCAPLTVEQARKNLALNNHFPMALNLNKDLKRFFSIAEVAEMFGINATTLRFWEKQFPQITPKKSGRNVRQYTKDDIERVRVVHNLVKVRGMKLDAAASLIRRNKDGVEKTTDLLDTLREIRAELMDIKHNLATLE